MSLPGFGVVDEGVVPPGTVVDPGTVVAPGEVAGLVVPDWTRTLAGWSDGKNLSTSPIRWKIIICLSVKDILHWQMWLCGHCLRECRSWAYMYQVARKSTQQFPRQILGLPGLLQFPNEHLKLAKSWKICYLDTNCRYHELKNSIVGKTCRNGKSLALGACGGWWLRCSNSQKQQQET